MEPLSSRARQWSRTAWGLALLFGSLPAASRIFVGVWGFEGSAELACLCTLLGIYFHFAGRRYIRLKDAALMLDRALQRAREGHTEQAIHILTQAIRLSPRLWQAYQYRGELRLLQGSPATALDDFNTAIRLAPEESDLRTLRQQAERLLAGDSTDAP